MVFGRMSGDEQALLAKHGIISRPAVDAMVRDKSHTLWQNNQAC